MEPNEVLKIKGDLTQEFAACHAQMDKAQARYDGDVKVLLREGATKHIPPTAYAEVQSAAGAVLTENEVLTVPPRDKTNKEKDPSAKLEKLYSALVRRIDKDQMLPLLYQAKQSAILYGLSVAKS